ncbi:MAG: hypothetical protein U0517_01110 [Candidatus Andersenbacteria bacterium]
MKKQAVLIGVLCACTCLGRSQAADFSWVEFNFDPAADNGPGKPTGRESVVYRHSSDLLANLRVVSDGETYATVHVGGPTEPAWATQTQPVVFLTGEQMLVCDDLGSCQVVYCPYDATESAIATGQQGAPKYSVRLVWIDTPAGAQMWTKGYFRVLSQEVDTMERWYNTALGGHSWDSPRELFTLPKKCIYDQVDDTISMQAGMTLDHTTCDPIPGAFYTSRFAVTLIDNECTTSAQDGTPGLVSATLGPTAPMLILHEERSGYQVMQGESLLSTKVPLCTPVP